MIAAPHPPVACDADGDRPLRWAAIAFTVAVLLHNGDHARRGGGSVDLDLFLLGTVAIVPEVVAVVLAVQRHRLAPVVAATLGPALALGYVVAHVLPERSWISDPLFAGGASALSQTAAILEICAALALGAAGATTLRRRGGLAGIGRPRAATRTVREALAEPAVIALVLGNVVVVATSLATR